MLANPFLVLDYKRKNVVYEAATLPQARGYVDGCEDETVIAIVAELPRPEFLHQLCVFDMDTGQVVMRGPVIDISIAADRMLKLRMGLLPVLDGGQAEGVPTC